MSDAPTIVQNSRCPICNGNAMALCLPHPRQSIASDGRVISHELRKLSCVVCGTAFHASAVPPETVQAIYDKGYSLARVAQKSDTARARDYAQWIQTVCTAPRSILEVGCGSGALLKELSAFWPDAVCFGVDPALSSAERSAPRLRLERGFVEDVPNDIAGFDLIVAVNVIEHTLNPGAFLASLSSRLGLDGKIVIVCPAAEPPNSELLFFDHLYSLTATALRLSVVRTPLVTRKTAPAPTAIGDFQMVVFDTADQASDLTRAGDSFLELGSKRLAYLKSWGELDQNLLGRARSAPRLVAFGGGQTAALLRAYAPDTWARIELIVLDDEDEAWTLGIPVASYQDCVRSLAGARILIAASPRVQGAIADRLRRDGLQPIRWDDLITN